MQTKPPTGPTVVPLRVLRGGLPPEQLAQERAALERAFEALLMEAHRLPEGSAWIDTFNTWAEWLDKPLSASPPRLARELGEDPSRNARRGIAQTVGRRSGASYKPALDALSALAARTDDPAFVTILRRWIAYLDRRAGREL